MEGTASREAVYLAALQRIATLRYTRDYAPESLWDEGFQAGCNLAAAYAQQALDAGIAQADVA